MVRPRTDTAMWELSTKRAVSLLFTVGHVNFTRCGCTRMHCGETACYLHLPQFKLLAGLYHVLGKRKWAGQQGQELRSGHGQCSYLHSRWWAGPRPKAYFSLSSWQEDFMNTPYTAPPHKSLLSLFFCLAFVFPWPRFVSHRCFLNGLNKAGWQPAEHQNSNDFVQHWKHFARCVKSQSGESNTKSSPIMVWLWRRYTSTVPSHQAPLGVLIPGTKKVHLKHRKKANSRRSA